MAEQGLPGSAPRHRLAPFAVNLDWLTLNMRGPFRLARVETAERWRSPEFPGEPMQWRGSLWLVPTDIRTSQFARVLYLCDEDGDKLLTLYCDPHTDKMFPRDAYQVQFHNRLLYDGSWKLYLDQLYQMGFTYQGVSRIDIAADGLRSECNFLAPMESALFGTERYYGRSLWKPTVKGRKVRNAELGTRASNKFLRCYDKTDEMNDPARDKPHIREAWRRSLGTDPRTLSDAVIRLEIQTKNTEVTRYYPHCKDPKWLPQMTSAHFRAETFASMVTSGYPALFDFRTPHAESERARDAVSVLDWDWTRITDCEVEARERSKRTIALPVNTIKSTCRTMYLLYMATADTTYLQQVRNMVEAAELQKWFPKAETRWRREAALLSGEERTRDGRTAEPGTRELFDRLRLA